MTARMVGRSALVTGGTSGIGFAVAQELVTRGARVVLFGRNEEKGAAAQRRLAEQSSDVVFVAGDVARSEDVARAVKTAVQRFGGLDVAVNAAADASGTFAPTAEVAEAEFDRTIAVTLKGVWLSMRHELEAMLARGKGSIVNVSSFNGLSGTPMAAAYCAAKHGVHGLTKTAALEYAGRGIRVNAVCPGAHRTPMLQSVFDRFSPQDPSAAEAMYASKVPLKRIGDPAECARAIVWLLSDEASYVTGTLLPVDGGLAAGVA